MHHHLLTLLEECRLANDDNSGEDVIRNQGRIEVLKRILDGEEMEKAYGKYRTSQQ